MDRRTRKSNTKERKWIEGQENLILKKGKWIEGQEDLISKKGSVIPKMEGTNKILIKCVKNTNRIAK